MKLLRLPVGKALLPAYLLRSARGSALGHLRSRTHGTREAADLAGVIISGIRIDDGDRGGKDQAGGTTRGGGRACRRGEDLVPEPDLAVGQRLALGNARANELNDLGRFRKFPMVQPVAGLDLGEGR
ncbi:hypothetical protein ACVIRM_003684 [Rhizobium laguerreae]